MLLIDLVAACLGLLSHPLGCASQQQQRELHSAVGQAALAQTLSRGQYAMVKLSVAMAWGLAERPLSSAAIVLASIWRVI